MNARPGGTVTSLQYVHDVCSCPSLHVVHEASSCARYQIIYGRERTSEGDEEWSKSPQKATGKREKVALVVDPLPLSEDKSIPAKSLRAVQMRWA